MYWPLQELCEVVGVGENRWLAERLKELVRTLADVALGTCPGMSSIQGGGEFILSLKEIHVSFCQQYERVAHEAGGFRR